MEQGQRLHLEETEEYVPVEIHFVRLEGARDSQSEGNAPLLMHVDDLDELKITAAHDHHPRLI